MKDSIDMYEKLKKDLMEYELELLNPFLEVYESKEIYLKSNGKWDYTKISNDVGLSVQTCRKWMKKIGDNIERK